MENFFIRILKGSEIIPPDNISDALFNNFSNAFNIEWYINNGLYEAVFYKDNYEYIAVFNNDGQLFEYKIHLPVNGLPGNIKNTLLDKGEIMSIVLINKGNSISYEIIYRNQNLTRYLLYLDEIGNIIQDKVL